MIHMIVVTDDRITCTNHGHACIS